MTVRLFLTTLFFSVYFSYSINYQLEGNNLDFINQHFILNKSNATRLDNELIFDIYRLEFIISNPDKIKYNIKNINWIKTNHSTSILSQHDLISISDIFNYKGCPSVYLDIFPYKFQDDILYYAESIDIEFIIDESIEYNSCNPSHNSYNADFIKNNLNQFTEIDYLIITKDFLFEAAENLKNIHSDLNVDIMNVDSIYSLYENDNSGQSIRNYILDQIELSPSLNYLLILGDETVVPPIYCSTIPSDDYYTSSNNCAANPQLATGRISVSSINDANDIVSKIDGYIQNLVYPLDVDQSWRMNLGLISDDENNPNPNKYPELSHTENSDLLYQQIKNNLIVNTFYGIDYEPIQNSDGLLHSNLTDDLISHINNGVAMINYIGHGNYNTLADEKILQLDRDINLINSLDYKLPIWIVGTCSFGEYDGKNSMAEELLLKNNGAIAIISTVRGIGETSNINYLTKLFDKINDYLENDNNYGRLGDIFKNSKNDSPSEDLFHLFGDPALPLPFPKENNIIVDDVPSELLIGQYTSLNVGPYNANLNVFDKEKIIIKGYETGDTVVYNTPGNSIYAGNFYESVCFITSLDASECDSCAYAYIQVNHDNLSYNRFQNIFDLDIIFNSDDSESDFHGPEISFFLDDYSLIDNNETVFQNSNILVQLSDQSGINLMEGLGHNIRYWFNDEQYQNIVDSDELTYTSNCNEESIGYFNINLSNSNSGANILYVEAWDNFNNRTLQSISLNIQDAHAQFKAYDVYNFPNPFKYQTNFTFKISDYPAIATISIFDLSGRKIKVIDNYECLTSFCSVPWNGKNDFSKKINNGTYIYHLKLKNGNQIFEDLYKITKLK
tara:strand:- start:431 stop:2962 length:2532 start_codon:yes stop_codon:yes gene_type:complete